MSSAGLQARLVCSAGLQARLTAGDAYTGQVELPERLVESIRYIAASYPDVRALYVFGSHLKGDRRLDSDLDLGVLYRSRQPLGATLALEQVLEQTVRRKVDLVDAGRAGAFLALDIVRGERIFCREPTETDRFELYVLRRAGDLLPFERQRQVLLLSPHR